MRLRRSLLTQSSFLLSCTLCLFLSSCKPTIALYDQYSYVQATSLKVDLQNLAAESNTTDYSEAVPDIKKVNIEIQKANEYSKGRLLNSISTKQYEILLSDKHFYKIFLDTWKKQGKESQTAADELSLKIGELMDQVIKLENGKNKSNNK